MPSDETSRAPGACLYLVATPLGNLEDMTYRAVRVLGEVDVIAAEDTRRTGNLLRHFEIPTPRLVSFFDGNEAARTDELIEQLRGGARVAVVTDAGTPGISDPGQRLVARAVAEGIRIESIPGPVAAITALVASGLATERFLFVGFVPRREGARQELFGRLSRESATLIIYEAPDRVAATLADLALAMGAERRVVVARELTKLHEEMVRGTLADVAREYAQRPRKGEHTLVVEGATAVPVEPAEVETQVRALLARGLGPKDVAARLVVSTGLPRRKLYQLALALAREGAGGDAAS